MLHRIVPAVEADEPSTGTRSPVTLIRIPWIRLVSSRRARTTEPVPIPHERDHAAARLRRLHHARVHHLRRGA